MKRIMLLVLGMFFSFSAAARAEDITAKQLAKMLESDKNIVVIDVRTPSEFNMGHIKGAININFNEGDFQARIARLDKNKTYALYCRSGNRSSRALSIFEKNNLKYLHMYKGFNSTSGSGLDVEK